jgi:hypothetical protein
MLLGQLMLPKVIRFMGSSPNAGNEFDQNVRTTLPAPLRDSRRRVASATSAAENVLSTRARYFFAAASATLD